MFKVIAFVFMVIACVCAAPKPEPKPEIYYSAPIVSAPLATSSAVFSQYTSPYVAAAYPYAYSAYSPYTYAAPYAYSSYYF